MTIVSAYVMGGVDGATFGMGRDHVVRIVPKCLRCRGKCEGRAEPRHAFVFTMNDTHPGISITLELPERKMFSLYMSVPFAKIRTT